MKKIMLFFALNLIVICSYGQIKQDSLQVKQDSLIAQLENLTGISRNEETPPIIENLITPIYKLFPTTNVATSLKLNTVDGRIWQVHYGKNGGFEGYIPINSKSLLGEQKEINGRYTLQATTNIYTFILLDQIDGFTWVVQWNSEQDKRFVRFIYDSK